MQMPSSLIYLKRAIYSTLQFFVVEEEKFVMIP